MKFLRTLIAATIGTLLALALTFAILFITLASSAEEPEPYVRNNSILKLDFSGTLSARSVTDPVEELLNSGISKKVSLESLKENLAKAQAHDHIKGVLLEIDFVTAGWSNLQEAHRLIRAFRDSSNKFVYATTNDLGYNEQGYFLATSADSIFSPPESFFEFDGFYSQVMFMEGFMEKIGVEPDIIRHGKYKGAVEPFMRDDLSEENEYQLQQIINNVSNIFVEAVSAYSGKSADELNMLMNDRPSLASDRGYREGLIDSLLYEDELYALIKKRMGLDETREFHTISNHRYFKVKRSTAGLSTPSSQDKIGIIYAEGQIMPTANGGFPFAGEQLITANSFREQLDHVKNDDDIKALVIRINSPGGSGATSDLIWRMIRQTANEMPVIVSMGPVAASGGYYIAMAADSIVAEPTTITGSIGVFATRFNTRQLFNEKLGLTFDEVKSHEHADWLNPMRDLSPAEVKAFQQYVDDFYRTFISKVAESRGMEVDAVDEIAQGRVWTGADAREQELVDVLGGLDTALDIAAEKADITDYSVVKYPEPKTLYEVLMGSAAAQAKSFIQNAIFGETLAATARQQYHFVKQREPMLLFPYKLNIQ